MPAPALAPRREAIATHEDIVLDTLHHAAFILGRSVDSMNRYRKEGMPGDRGAWNLREMIAWFTAKVDKRESRKRTNENIAEIEREHAEIKRDRDRLKLEKERGELVERAAVEAEFTRRALELRQNLQGLAVAAAPVVAPELDQRDAEAILTDAVMAFLEQYSRPLPDELVTEDGTEGDEEGGEEAATPEPRKRGPGRPKGSKDRSPRRKKRAAKRRGKGGTSTT